MYVKLLARQNMDWFDNALRMFAPFATRAGGLAGEKPAEPQKAASKEVELEELKTQLADMQSQLSKLVKDS